MAFTIHPLLEQGTPEWLAMRKGRITGSKFKDARDRLKNGNPSSKCALYAADVARERCGGKAAEVYQNAAMRFGTEQEPLARAAYEKATGNVVFEVGFITDNEGYFGLSPDGLIDDDGVLEIKTMVSSDTLFKALVDGDISEYIDQINGYLWMLGRQWVDLVLWAPDLAELGLAMKIIRIERDEEAIAALEADLLKFLALVRDNESKLRKAAEQARLEADRERIRAEEAARLEREAEAERKVREAAEEMARKREQDEADRIAREQAGAVSAARIRDELIVGTRAPLTATEVAEKVVQTMGLSSDSHRVSSIDIEAQEDDGERITLGQINARLAPVSITVAGLSMLGYEPVAVEKAARMYRASDFRHICAAISAHVLAAPVKALEAA